MSAMAKKTSKARTVSKSGDFFETKLLARSGAAREVRVNESAIGKIVRYGRRRADEGVKLNDDGSITVRVIDPATYPPFPTLTSKHVLGSASSKGSSRELAVHSQHPNGKQKIVSRLAERMSSRGQAEDWYKHHKIPAFGNRTSSQLVRMGMTDAVIKYLDGIDSGVHA